jgi:1,4-dihydroxy-2-naphthoate octaprenyltransferase
MSVEIRLSGFFFLFIIITNIASNVFGYKTFGDVDSDAQLQMINKDPKKFKISYVLILLEHLGIIFLAVTLFIAFGSYNLILGIVWCISRVVEALIQIYDKKNYWGLLGIAMKYSDTNSADKDELTDLGNNILKTKEFRFVIAQLFFSIGTFAYSILFVIYGVVPLFIGWFGIVAGILYGFGNGIFLIKPDFKVLWNIGGGLILLFELILGGWLLFFG